MAASTGGRKSGHRAGRDQSFYPQIPFSSQPQFREPINQGCGKNLANTLVFVRFRPEMFKHLVKNIIFWATLLEHIASIAISEAQRQKTL